jgi:hypothetical protein
VNHESLVHCTICLAQSSVIMQRNSFPFTPTIFKEKVTESRTICLDANGRFRVFRIVSDEKEVIIYHHIIKLDFYVFHLLALEVLNRPIVRILLSYNFSPCSCSIYEEQAAPV